MSHRLLVLCWHNVLPTWAFPESAPGAALRGFRKQLRLLRRASTVVPLQQALADLSAGRPLPPRAVALTFDDGYADNAVIAAPLLREQGLPATFFLVTGFLSGTTRAWWEDLAWGVTHARTPTAVWAGQRFELPTPEARRAAVGELSNSLKLLSHEQRTSAVEDLLGTLEPRGTRSTVPDQFMDWSAAQALLASGHDVGSHTCTHTVLSRETVELQEHEVQASRRILEERLRCRIDVLALPNGRQQDYDGDTLRLMAQAGYRFGLTTRAGFARPEHPPLEVRRVLLEPETSLTDVLKDAARAVRSRASATRRH